ncbi:MAG: 3'-5' exonuclease, partial [Polyangiales bacterium]
GLEDDLFPFKSFRDDDEGTFGRDRLGEDADAVEEERRLAYVAITRAKEELTLFHATTRTVFGQTRWCRPSRFLRDLPAADLDQRAADVDETAAATRPVGWGALPSRPPVSRPPFVHPQASAKSIAREPGERFVERDDHVHEGGHDGADDHDSLRRGGRVKHKRFGEGRVVELQAAAGSSEAAVLAEFPGWGTMKVLRRFLEVV